MSTQHNHSIYYVHDLFSIRHKNIHISGVILIAYSPCTLGSLNIPRITIFKSILDDHMYSYSTTEQKQVINM